MGRSQEFAKGDKRWGVRGRKSPSEVQRQSPGGDYVLGRSPQKPETHAE